MLDAHFPHWRSIEVFGPAGAGKSYFCRRTRDTSDVLTTCDGHIVRYYLDREMWPVTKAACKFLSERIVKNYHVARGRVFSDRYWRNAEPELLHYIDTVDEAIAALALRTHATKTIRRSLRWTGAFIGLAYRQGGRVLVDDGLVQRLLMRLIMVSGRTDTGRSSLSLVRRCLESHPWDKNALLIDATAETCMMRQVSRNRIVFRLHKPQLAYHAAARQLIALCKESGWRVAQLNNEQDNVNPLVAMPV